LVRSIVSPILYNIYFHEFDKFIHYEFTQTVKDINTKERIYKFRPFNPLYNKIRKIKYKFKYPEILKTLKQSYSPETVNSNEFLQLRKNFKIAFFIKNTLNLTKFKRISNLTLHQDKLSDFIMSDMQMIGYF
jgi:hypothetical protein